MNDIIKKLHENMMSLIGNTLGSSFEPLPYSIDLTKNRITGSKNRYGVQIGSQETEGGITKALNVTQTFDVILTAGYINKAGCEKDQLDKTFHLLEKMNEVIKKLYLSKCGYPQFVMNVERFTCFPPEYEEEVSFVSIRGQITIRYRHLIN